MQYILTKFKIKAGLTEEFLAKLKEHNEKRAEVMEGLKHAGIKMECLFVERTSLGDYFWVFKKVESEEVVRKQLAHPKLPGDKSSKFLIDQYLEREGSLESLADFEL